MVAEKIDKIAKVGKKVSPQGPQTEPNKDYFEALMQQRRVTTEQTTAQQTEEIRKAPTLMDEVSELNHKVNQAQKASPQQIAAQAEDIIAQIDEIKSKLDDKNLKIKAPVQTLLKRKLTHIDESLKVALTRAGVEYTPPDQSVDFQKPINRFLRFLTHGQDQLSSLAEHVNSLNDAHGGMLQPADMLLLQIKVNYIQQEIELFTSMLNKALESTKTIMNIQV